MATWYCCLLVAAAIFAPSNAKDEFKQLKSMMRKLESKVIEQQETIELLASVFGSVTDEVLSALSNVLQAPLLPALDLVDSRNVTLLVTPSGRKLYQVVGSSSTPYTCFPGNYYCSCPSYKFSVMKKEEHAMCKHVLAVRLSNAMGVTKVLDVSNEELTDLLLQLE